MRITRMVTGPLLLLSTLALALPAQAAQVTRILDADTIWVREGGRSFKVRFACIDAPEKSQRPYGAQAKAALAAMLPVGSEVTLAVQKGSRDAHDRRIAEVYRNGTNLNLALVQQGQAFVYWQYIRQCDRNAYGAAEGSARLRGVGVWSVPGGITRPWDWRRHHR